MEPKATFTPLEIKISDRQTFLRNQRSYGVNKTFLTGFTKKDLVVVLGCVVFLLVNLGAIDGGARRRAKEMVCLSNLLKWGVVFQMYTNDNEGLFCGGREVEGVFREHEWVYNLKPYYENRDICLCPATTKTWCDGVLGTFVAWDFRCMEGTFEELYWYYDESYGSYGKNSWCSQWPEHGACPDLSSPHCCNWRTINVAGADNIPLFLDSLFMGGFPTDTDIPPEFEACTFWSGCWAGEMNRYLIPRHGGGINSLFVDLSVRKVALKQLYKLKWHRLFDTNGPWTIAGFAGNEAACAAAWDEAAPWMSDFPEY